MSNVWYCIPFQNPHNAVQHVEATGVLHRDWTPDVRRPASVAFCGAGRVWAVAELVEFKPTKDGVLWVFARVRRVEGVGHHSLHGANYARVPGTNFMPQLSAATQQELDEVTAPPPPVPLNKPLAVAPPPAAIVGRAGQLAMSF